MKGLEVGGLALIIRCQQDSRNIGKCVRLLRFLKAGEVYQSPAGEEPGPNLSGSDVFLVEGDLFDYSGEPHPWIQKCPEYLMPLQGDPDGVVVREKELAIS